MKYFYLLLTLAFISCSSSGPKVKFKEARALNSCLVNTIGYGDALEKAGVIGKMDDSEKDALEGARVLKHRPICKVLKIVWPQVGPTGSGAHTVLIFEFNARLYVYDNAAGGTSELTRDLNMSNQPIGLARLYYGWTKEFKTAYFLNDQQ